MGRVTSVEVQALVGVFDVDMSPFIATATMVVDEDLVAKNPTALSVNRLKDIELYLAAHFFAIARQNGGLKQVQIGEAMESYEGTKGMKGAFGFATSPYGMTALTLDTSGALAALASSPMKAQFRVV